MYIVYGWDAKTDDKVILHEEEYSSLALIWAKKYTRGGNMGGWTKVFVVRRYIDDYDWDGEYVYEEETLWSCWQEPMPWSDNALDTFGR
jgi:hypothetical protein